LASRFDVGDVDAVPAAHDPGDGDHARARLDRGRHPDADRQQLVERRPDPVRELDDEQGRAVEAGVDVVLRGQREHLLGDDLVRRVPERHAQLALSDEHPRDEPGAPGEADQLGAPAAARRRACLDRAGALQLLDDRRHRRG